MEGLPWLRVMGGGGKGICENREQNGKVWDGGNTGQFCDFLGDS